MGWKAGYLKCRTNSMADTTPSQSVSICGATRHKSGGPGPYQRREAAQQGRSEIARQGLAPDAARHSADKRASGSP